MGKTLYSHDKDDLINAVRVVIEELRKTEFKPDIIDSNLDDQLTQTQAAKLLRVSVPTLLVYRKKKIIPYYKIGKMIFYSKKEIMKAARQHVGRDNNEVNQKGDSKAA